jgi:hypothetical protein
MSTKVGAAADCTTSEEKAFICHDCGTYMILDSSHGANSYRKCQHCETVGEITTEAEEERCGSCGLDPSEEMQETSDLSILWKSGSEIRRIMNDDKAGLDAGKSVGDFLRNFCGPHCNFADRCDQTVKNLVVCHKEYKLNESESEMSKKSRERRKEERERSQLNTYKEKPKQTRVLCAKFGWFERHIVNGTYHTKQSGDKES